MVRLRLTWKMLALFSCTFTCHFFPRKRWIHLHNTVKVLHFVVSSNQTCGVPGHFIADNVAFLRDVTHSGTAVAVLSLDQEKAFDRVDWDFLRATLSRMGFGPSFIRWVNLLYSGIESAVNVNEHVTPFFRLTRGVRQGCTLSPLLYVLYVEVLVCYIHSSPEIFGLCLPGAPLLLPVISQYADDTSLVVNADRAIVFDSYYLFECLNLSKCKGLWLGGWSDRLDPPILLQWSSSFIKVLGVFIGVGDGALGSILLQTVCLLGILVANSFVVGSSFLMPLLWHVFGMLLL